MLQQQTRLVLSSLLGIVLGVIQVTGVCGDEAAVRKTLESYVDAFNQHDVDAVAGYWTKDCVHIDRETDTRTEGRQAIADDLKSVFESMPEIRMVGSVKSVQIVQPTVATVSGEAVLSSQGRLTTTALFTAVVVNEGDRWLLATVDESPAPEITSPQSALRELEWLVGDWRDESEDVVVETKCRWSPSGAFLIRAYAISSTPEQGSEGTQVIGWDAKNQSIRSWNFDSSGGFGEATWSRSGDEWLVRSLQTGIDGSVSSGTYVLTKRDADSMTVQLIAQDVDGMPVPNQPPIVVVRVTGDESAELVAPETNASGVKQ